MKIPLPRFQDRFAEWAPLAEGGEGTLYRVRDRWTGRVCALKLARDGAGRDALLHEFSLLSRLRHPCLVRSLDLVRDGDDLGHLLEYVPAVDPAALWESGGEAAVRAALVQALRGLAYLHRHGWVHGDVAPGNVLVWRDGERWRARIADLGLALRADATATTGVRGTPGYLSPEAARGDRLEPRSDWFALAATAVHWIDGRGPWGGLRAEEALAGVLRVSEPLAPRRGVAPDLRGWIAALGDPEPSRRAAPSWAELREDTPSWGEPVLEPGVHGVGEAVDAWVREASDLAPGSSRAWIVKGRAGSGRRTAAGAMARALTAEGWTALQDLPLASLRDWLALEESDPDPVRIARALGERFAGRDVALLWPEATAEFEARLLQAFVAGRGGPDVAERTCVIHAASPAADAPVDAWLRGTRATVEVDWELPVEEGLASIAMDLFPEEEGYGARARPAPAVQPGETPLSLVLRKRSALDGRDAAAVVEGVDAVAGEVRAVWNRLEVPGREALALLAASSWGWSEGGLATALAWTAEETPAHLAHLNPLPILRVDYEEGERRLRPADWMVRDAIVGLAIESLDRNRVRAVRDRLEAAPECHPGDHRLAASLVRFGVLAPTYTLGALDRALQAGRFEAVLRVREGMVGGGLDPGEDRGRFRERFLRAAKRLGRFAVEVDLLEEALAEAGEPDAEYEVRRDLAKALFAIGRWREAITQCDAMREMPGIAEEDRLWAELHRAEILWQAGQFEEAEREYQGIEVRLPPKAARLWLKYGLGRARSEAQRERMDTARHWLELAQRLAGPEVCSADPLFMNTKAGLIQALESAGRADGYCQSATIAAETLSDWVVYVMACARWSATRANQGLMFDAQRLGRRAYTTALALGSKRMGSLAACYEGHVLYELGEAGEALRTADWALALGETAHDGTVMDVALRLRSLMSARLGWFDLHRETAELLRSRVSRDVEPFLESVAVREALTRCETEQALGLLEGVLDRFERIGGHDTALDYRLLRAGAMLDLGRAGEALDELGLILVDSQRRGQGAVYRVARLLASAWGGGESGQLNAVRQALDDLVANGQVLDVAYWASLVLRPGNVSTGSGQDPHVRRTVLEAIKKIAGSIDGKRLKAQFLEAPRIARSLQFVATRPVRG